jgi:hypothetical protein
MAVSGFTQICRSALTLPQRPQRLYGWEVLGVDGRSHRIGTAIAVAVATWITAMDPLVLSRASPPLLVLHPLVVASAWVGVWAWITGRWRIAMFAFLPSVVGPWPWIFFAPMLPWLLSISATVSSLRERRGDTLAATAS